MSDITKVWNKADRELNEFLQKEYKEEQMKAEGYDKLFAKLHSIEVVITEHQKRPIHTDKEILEKIQLILATRK